MSFDSRVERITLTRQKVRSFRKRGRNALKTLHGSNRIGRCFGNTKKKETIERLKLRVDEASNDNDRCVRLLSSFNRVFRVYDLSIILRKKRKRTKRRKEGKIIFFRSLEPIETMFATKLDGHRSADCSLRAVMKLKCVVISCNFQYRLKSIRLAFLPIYKKARGCTWSAWSARATHR